MKTVSLFPFVLPLLVSLTELVAADEFAYIPATVANTTLADGTALKVVATAPAAPEEITRGTSEAEPNNHWHWREGAGSGTGSQRGVFAADGHHGNDAPMLRTLVSGLKPKTDYQVFGFFWVAGYATDDATPAGDTQWDIRLGCGIAKMMGYGHRDNAGLPGTIGRRDGGEGTLRQMDAPLRPAAGELLDRDGDKRLFRASLGSERTDAKGALVVYVDDQAEDSNEGRTWYDGIGVVPTATRADVGSGAPGALHLAVRAGDWEMARRELEAGANLNALDHDGLTPLFYACVAQDAEPVATMLKAGAAPDVAGQSLSPLWAAATAGDVKLTAKLLDSGASVPLDPLPQYAQRDKLKPASLAHPAVAAIRNGSLKTLKLLLAKQPKMDLDRLYASGERKLSASEVLWSSNPYPVQDAVTNDHPELAEFLIERGCRVEGMIASPTVNYVDRGAYLSKKNAAKYLLIAAIMNQPPMHGVVAALAKRGVTMVDTTPLKESPFVLPCDGLTAAALAGDAELTAHLLPSAKAVGRAYQIQLTVLAEAGGNKQVMEMLRQQFGEVKMPRWNGGSPPAHSEEAADSARVFQPRSIPPKPRDEIKGKRVLAVIASPATGGPAAAIAAKASASDGWVVVEREQIAALLREGDLAMPWQGRVKDLGSIGDRLSADVLVITSLLRSEHITLLRLEAVDVKTGLLIDRLHLDLKEFKPDEFCDNYLAEVRRKLEQHLAGGALTAVTLLPITADEHLAWSDGLEGLLYAGLMQEIDQTPGMIALTRQQMQPLAEEKTFQQPNKLWGAAWTVEGGLRALDDRRVELALRVRSLGKDAAAHDVKIAGDPSNIQALVKGAWKQLAVAIRGDAAAPPAAASPEAAQQAATEAARLLQEADWLSWSERPYEATALIDAAEYLGADPLRSALLKMRIHMDSRHFMDLATMDNWHGAQAAPGFPLTPTCASHAASCLDEHLELLRLSAESWDRVVQSMRDPASAASSQETLTLGRWRYLYDEMWSYFDIFIRYRGALQPLRMNPGELARLKTFDEELDRYVKHMFGSLQPDDESRDALMERRGYTPHDFRVVPALGPALTETIQRIWGDQPFPMYATKTFYESFLQQTYDADLGPQRAGIMCDLLEKAMAGKDVPCKELRHAEIAFLLARGEAQAPAARHLLQTRAATSYRLMQPLQDWVPPLLLSRWIPMLENLDWPSPQSVPPHGESVVPALLHAPAAAPDMLLRNVNYATSRKRWLAMGQDENSRLEKQQGFVQMLERTMNEIVSKGGTASDFDDLLASSRLVEKIYGVNLARDLEPKLAKLRPHGKAESFGSTNQFPILNFEGSVATKLLGDVRAGITDQPAMITRCLVDPKNRHILWLIVQPYQGWDFKIHEPLLEIQDGGYLLEDQSQWISSVPPFIAGQPWLVAIDSRDGRTLRKINLGTISGRTPENSPQTAKCVGLGDSTPEGMIANDTHLLIHTFWGLGDIMRDLNSMRAGDLDAVLAIDRETGEIQKLPKKTRLDDIVMVDTHGTSASAVASVGSSFFIVQAIEPDGKSLWQFTPGKPAKLLAQSGRRPEESPFDAPNHTIGLLRADAGRLLVASSWDHFAYYDPAKEQWTDAPARSAEEWKAHDRELYNNEYRAIYLPPHVCEHADGSFEAFAEASKTSPGRLKFQCENGDAPTFNLPVSLQVPSDYPARFQVFSNAKHGTSAADKVEWIRIADLVRSNMLIPVILNQTADTFVLGLQWVVTPNETMHINPTHPPCLPFLWILDKQDAHAAIKRVQEK